MDKMVYIPQEIAIEGEEYLLERGYSILHGCDISQSGILNDIKKADAVLLRTLNITKEILLAAPFLKVISKHGVGVDNIDVEAATQLGIRITNAPMSNAVTVSEHAFAMLLALSKQLCQCNMQYKNTKNFDLRYTTKTIDISNKILGIVGFGKIGKMVAKRATAFDMQIMVYDPYIRPEDIPTNIVYTNQLMDVFRTCDFITLHMPLNTETKGCVGKMHLDCMKPTAFFVNVSRGELTIEKELIVALQEGRFAGAGIDVYEQEPPPASHPFFTMPNVIVTPHNAALTKECVVRMAVDAAKGIDEILSGRYPTWSVN